MCEIAVLRASIDASTFVNVAKALYESNQDSLGVVGVYDKDDHFEYDIQKSVEPDWDSFEDFFSVFSDDPDAWRIVIHARIATSGGRGYAQAHPIQTRACDKDDAQYVVHNGSVTSDSRKRRELRMQGHEFTTEVDTEVIAHWVGVPSELPTEDEEEDWDEPDDGLYGSLNYLVFGEDGIFVRMTNKYEVLEDDFIIICGHRNNWDLNGETAESGYHLIRPGNHESKHRERARSYTYTRRSSSGTGGIASTLAAWGSKVAGRGKRKGSRQGTKAANKGRDLSSDDDTGKPAWTPDEDGFIPFHRRGQFVYCDKHETHFKEDRGCTECNDSEELMVPDNDALWYQMPFGFSREQPYDAFKSWKHCEGCAMMYPTASKCRICPDEKGTESEATHSASDSETLRRRQNPRTPHRGD